MHMLVGGHHHSCVITFLLLLSTSSLHAQLNLINFPIWCTGACSTNPCQNGGVCCTDVTGNLPQGYSCCQCTPGYTGKNCGTANFNSIPFVGDIPSGIGLTCTNPAGLAVFNEVFCLPSGQAHDYTCPPSNPCPTNPCLSGGTCYTTQDEGSSCCLCGEGKSGANCEVDDSMSRGCYHCSGVNDGLCLCGATSLPVNNISCPTTPPTLPTLATFPTIVIPTLPTLPTIIIPNFTLPTLPTFTIPNLNNLTLPFTIFPPLPPTPPGSTTLCFPGTSMVRVKNGRKKEIEKKMRELEIGDEVLSLDSQHLSLTHSPIISFTHRDEREMWREFLSIYTHQRAVITLTRGHYMWRGDQHVPAEDIKVGDKVFVVAGDGLVEDEVEAIERVLDKGLFNPHTLTGNIIVNDVLASTYTGFLSARISHHIIWPLRMIYTNIKHLELIKEVHENVISPGVNMIRYIFGKFYY